jgi:hypothetical protein
MAPGDGFSGSITQGLDIVGSTLNGTALGASHLHRRPESARHNAQLSSAQLYLGE